MKEIKAIIQPFMLDAVVEALHEIPGLPAITVSPVTGIALERGSFDHAGRTKLELMVCDDQVESVVATIQRAAHTGNPGDGRLFVIPIEQTIKIRTGERDAD